MLVGGVYSLLLVLARLLNLFGYLMRQHLAKQYLLSNIPRTERDMPMGFTLLAIIIVALLTAFYLLSKIHSLNFSLSASSQFLFFGTIFLYL